MVYSVAVNFSSLINSTCISLGVGGVHLPVSFVLPFVLLSEFARVSAMKSLEALSEKIGLDGDAGVDIQQSLPAGYKASLVCLKLQGFCLHFFFSCSQTF